jgi:quercetin dioxygenase-like cupin family protein
MKVIPYTAVAPVHFDNEIVRGVAGRILIGKNDGASNFCMRLFEIAPEGHTPRHTHAWEHEIFIHEGSGEIYCDGRWSEVLPGHAAFIPANNEHQIKNTGSAILKFVCLVPPQAPEM